MLLTISTTAPPATDLGFLLHKHPDRVQRFDRAFGTAHVFFPDAAPERCTAALLLEVDPVGLVRTRARNTPDFSLGQYVNDRPYAASSLLASAMAGVFRTAMRGRCDARPELAAAALPLEITLPSLPCRGGPERAERFFGPLGWDVTATTVPLDPAFPDWGDSRHLNLTLRGELRLADALNQLYVLLPVLDEAKHYWLAPDEVDKLLRAGTGWLTAHPERGPITRRYLNDRHTLVRTAFARLADTDDTTEETLDPTTLDEDPTPDDTAPTAAAAIGAPTDITPAPDAAAIAIAPGAPDTAAPDTAAPDTADAAAAADAAAPDDDEASGATDAAAVGAPADIAAAPGTALAAAIAPGAAVGAPDADAAAADADAAVPADIGAAASDAAPAADADAASDTGSASGAVGGVAGREVVAVSLAERRLGAVVAVLRREDAARVIDLGCGGGKLVARLLQDDFFTCVAATDVSWRALEAADRRLRRGRREGGRVADVFQSALTYADERYKGYDAAVLMEVIEHVDPPRLGAVEDVVFGDARPRVVVVTTPNAEYNVRYEGLTGFRHADHRFEWTRAEFAAWAGRVAAAHGYRVRFEGVGDDDERVGAPTQMGVFTR
ncbi:3' terminal RNA ribose 2'-O-methyltransferase Hen1 [Actinomadura flavalba]|uniref:3' terminal RNA ribose 2'-O-methyltransferase Hen1 n=1 Tax=Actinomadura flavalba TaxID=1120938 RepID=UPI00037859A9|nr:3' terminal RNA ribose 2'-O-methyltransferase Hen1 [Actinomadura flavalba]